MTGLDWAQVDISLAQLVLVGVTALLAQVLGGLAGYGTGLLMPLVLVPIIGAQAIVPVISLSSIITNITRAVVFRESLDMRKALIITAFALPTTLIGAYFYTFLSSKGAAIVIGLALVLLVPLRRYLARRKFTLDERGAAGAGVIYGILTGGATGVGVVLMSILMAMGLTGQQVIATDAFATLILGVAKTGVFVAAGALPLKLWVVALLIGAMATPGALAAKWIARNMSVHIHDVLIEATIVVGGVVLLSRGLMM